MASIRFRWVGTFMIVVSATRVANEDTKYVVPARVLSVLTDRVRFKMSLLVMRRVTNAVRVFMFLFFYISAYRCVRIIFFNGYFNVICMYINHPYILFKGISPSATVTFDSSMEKCQFPTPVSTMGKIILQATIRVLGNVYGIYVGNRSFGSFDFRRNIRANRIYYRFAVNDLLLRNRSTYIVTISYTQEGRVEAPAPRVLMNINPYIQTFVILAAVISTYARL